jgi:hypothetical protein
MWLVDAIGVAIAAVVILGVIGLRRFNGRSIGPRVPVPDEQPTMRLKPVVPPKGPLEPPRPPRRPKPLPAPQLPEPPRAQGPDDIREPSDPAGTQDPRRPHDPFSWDQSW